MIDPRYEHCTTVPAFVANEPAIWQAWSQCQAQGKAQRHEGPFWTVEATEGDHFEITLTVRWGA